MNKRIQNSIKYCIIVIIVLFAVFLPFIIEVIYNKKPPIEFFNVDYKDAELLSYYASLFGTLSTVAVSVIALKQSKKTDEKSKELSRLELELTKKMELQARDFYDKKQQDEKEAIEREIPRFDFKISSYAGKYSDINFELRNVSIFAASLITSINLIVKKDDYIIFNKNVSDPKDRYLGPGETTSLSTKSKLFTNDAGERVTEDAYDYKNLTLLYEFSCDDQRGIRRYYEASCTIPDLDTFYDNSWDCHLVG